jgi:hypothetical protein
MHAVGALGRGIIYSTPQTRYVEGKAASAGDAAAAGAPDVIEITDRMMAAGMMEFYANRGWQNDWEVVARIFGAMRKAEDQTLK